VASSVSLCRVGGRGAESLLSIAGKFVMDSASSSMHSALRPQQCGFARHAKTAEALDNRKRPQRLPPPRLEIAHRIHQRIRPRDLVDKQRSDQKLRQQGLGIIR